MQFKAEAAAITLTSNEAMLPDVPSQEILLLKGWILASPQGGFYQSRSSR